MLSGALERAERYGRGAGVTRISTLLSVGLGQSGRQAEAVKMLRGSLARGEAEGWVRLFADEGPALMALLRVAVGRRDPQAAFAGRIRAAIGVERDGPLTAREREVLALLAEGLSNRAIAARLVTSEATIKSHVHHLIEKFGVSTRAEVLVSARRKGFLLLPPKG